MTGAFKVILKSMAAPFQPRKRRHMWRVYAIICRAPPAGYAGYDHTKAVPFAVCYPDGEQSLGQADNLTIALSGYHSLRGLQAGDIVAEDKTLGGGLEIVSRKARVAA